MEYIADIVIALLLIGALIIGLRTGLFASLGGLLGLIGGALATPVVLPWAGDLIADPGARRLVLVILAVGLLLVGSLIGSGIGHALRRGADRLRLRILERLLGGVVTVSATVLGLSLAAPALISAQIPTVSAALDRSRILQTIDENLPDPVQGTMDRWRAELPQAAALPALQGLLEEEAGAAASPDPAEADDPDIAAAAGSVALISGAAPACGSLNTGSGFVVAPGRVVTNAHVVAGVDAPRVQVPGERAREGRVVQFDPVRDLAVIAVDVNAEALPLAGTLDTGETGAVAGYPGGGDLQVDPASVSAVGDVLIDDIYGQDQATREVYRLGTDVEPGSSGGPLLTRDGEVAGVIFARDEARDGVGYAMTPSELEDLLDVVESADEAVPTGACVRR
ncbi:MAG: MarP family serine protease [Brachybacterium sp.]|nr:MarP family serine protease [Brachybacterium sp.]